MLKAIRKRIKSYKYEKDGKRIRVRSHFRTYYVKLKSRLKAEERREKAPLLRTAKLVGKNVALAGVAEGTRYSAYRFLKGHTLLKVPGQWELRVDEIDGQDVVIIDTESSTLANIMESELGKKLGRDEILIRDGNRIIIGSLRPKSVIRAILKDATTLSMLSFPRFARQLKKEKKIVETGKEALQERWKTAKEVEVIPNAKKNRFTFKVVLKNGKVIYGRGRTTASGRVIKYSIRVVDTNESNQKKD